MCDDTRGLGRGAIDIQGQHRLAFCTPLSLYADKCLRAGAHRAAWQLNDFAPGRKRVRLPVGVGTDLEQF